MLSECLYFFSISESSFTPTLVSAEGRVQNTLWVLQLHTGGNLSSHLRDLVAIQVAMGAMDFVRSHAPADVTRLTTTEPKQVHPLLSLEVYSVT